MKRRGDLARLLAIIILLLLIVGCLLIVIQAAFADQLAGRYPGSLRSRLVADYSADPEGTVRRPIDPAIIADRMADEAGQSSEDSDTLPQRIATATALFSEPVPTVTPIPPRGDEVGMTTPSGPGPAATTPTSPEEDRPTTIPAETATGAATGTSAATATGEATTTGTPRSTTTGTPRATTTGTPRATTTGTPRATTTGTPATTATSPAPTSRPTEEPVAPTATNTTRPTDTPTPTPTATAIVSLAASSKSASKAWVFPGEYVTYTIVTTNDGLANATGVTVSDTVPVEMILDPASIFGPASFLNGTTIQWGPFDVTAGQSAAVGFSAQPVYLPLPNVARRPVTNVARIAANAVAPFDRQAIVEVPYPPELSFATPANIKPQTVLVGQTGVVFQADVVNVGSAFVNLDATSRFEFEDATSQIRSTTLAAATFLPTGGTPVTLDFAPMDIPNDTTITGPSTQLSLVLTGLDENNVYDSRTLTTTSAADQITIKNPVLENLFSIFSPPILPSSLARFELCVQNVGTTDGDFYGPTDPDAIKAAFPPGSGWGSFLTTTVTSEPTPGMWAPQPDPGGEPAIRIALTDTLPLYTWPAFGAASCWEMYIVAPSASGAYTLTVQSTIEGQAGAFGDDFPVVVQAPPPPVLHDLAGSLWPSIVDQGEVVSFTIWVYNDGGSDVTLDTTSTLTFTDGADVYLSNLITPTQIPNWGMGSPVQLTFAPFSVGTITPGLWPTTLSLHGSDEYSQPHDATFTADIGNWVTVNAAPVLMAFPTPAPPPPFATGSPVTFSWVNVRNVGSAPSQFFNSSDNIVMSFEPGSGWAPFTNTQTFPPPGWDVITDTLNPVITFTVATADSPYPWAVDFLESFGFDTVAPATPGVYTFTVYSSLGQGVRLFADVFQYTVQ